MSGVTGEEPSASPSTPQLEEGGAPRRSSGLTSHLSPVRWKQTSPRALLESSKVLNEFNAKAELIVLQEDKNLISNKVN